MELPVGIFSAMEGAFRLSGPPVCEVEPRDMEMHTLNLTESDNKSYLIEATGRG